MPDEGNKQETPWPLPKFKFSADWGDEMKNTPFQEVSGLFV
jgi:hypothetical protein